MCDDDDSDDGDGDDDGYGGNDDKKFHNFPYLFPSFP